MKRRNLRLVSLILVIVTIASSLFCLSASAKDEESPPRVENASAACLYDKTHNKMLVNENPELVLNTSTSAKVMTGLIACKMLGERLDETVTVTAEMLRGTSGYSMRLKEGEKIKINDLLYGAICGSYNDAAYVLANVCAGNAQGFVSLMNEKARELGAESTAYTNPLGYPDNSAMVTTLSDTLKIALAASDNELEYCYVLFDGRRGDELICRLGISDENRVFSDKHELVDFWLGTLCRITEDNADIIRTVVVGERDYAPASGVPGDACVHSRAFVVIIGLRAS